MRYVSEYILRFLAIAAFVFSLSGLTGCQHGQSDREAYAPDEDGPFNVYLTYAPDTSHAMIVNYHTVVKADSGMVHYDMEPGNGRPNDYRFTSQQAETRQVPGLPDGRTIHSVTLTELEPDTTYYFIAGGGKAGFTEERKFRTAPQGDAPIRFVTGGDVGVNRTAKELFAAAAKYEPLFVLIGGDIAYANGELENARVWDAWFDQYEEFLTTPDGYTVPMVAGIGNHETNDIESSDPAIMAPFYTAFFGSQSDTTYFTRRFGDNLAIISLDTGHVMPHAGQVEWLRDQLEELEDVPGRFAVYHVPFYPGHRDFEGDHSMFGRTYWMPLFDEYGLPVAFENHDHVYKRTHPLKGGEIDPAGTVYLGDGCFGREPREVDREPRWYLVDTQSIAHFWVVETGGTEAQFIAVDAEGNVFDNYSRPLTGAAAMAE